MKLASPTLKLGMTTLIIFASIGLAVCSRAKANAADETATAHAVAVKGYLRCRMPFALQAIYEATGFVRDGLREKWLPPRSDHEERRVVHCCRSHAGERRASVSNATFREVRRGQGGHPGTRRHARYYGKDDQ